MKRYCVGKKYEKKDFLKDDAVTYYDINYEKLAINILEKEIMKLEIDTDIKQIWYRKWIRICLSKEYEMDIWNELYLKMIAIKGEQEPLFLKKSGIRIVTGDNEKKLVKMMI